MKQGSNKTKEWRKQKRVIGENGVVQRVGRMFKAIKSHTLEKAFPTEFIILLMKHAGVATPVFDAKLAELRVKELQLTGTSDIIEDVEIVGGVTA